MSGSKRGVGSACVGEMIGTFLLVFIGCGIVHTAVTTGAVVGSWQAGVVWGFAVALGVYVTASVSGAHINPAITISMAVSGGFPLARVLPYIGSQLVGAALAALLLYISFSSSIAAYEKAQGIERGQPGSEVTAAMYGEYFPNPTVGAHGFVAPGGDVSLSASLEGAWSNITVTQAIIMEILATMILALVVFAVTDPGNSNAPGAMAPFFIGMTVAVLVAIFGPMTQACMNPARDFGPRIVAALCGWKDIAFPGPRGAAATLSVYLAAPIVGATIGGLVYTKLIRPNQESAES